MSSDPPLHSPAPSPGGVAAPATPPVVIESALASKPDQAEPEEAPTIKFKNRLFSEPVLLSEHVREFFDKVAVDIHGEVYCKYDWWLKYFADHEICTKENAEDLLAKADINIGDKVKFDGCLRVCRLTHELYGAGRETQKKIRERNEHLVREWLTQQANEPKAGSSASHAASNTDPATVQTSWKDAASAKPEQVWENLQATCDTSTVAAVVPAQNRRAKQIVRLFVSSSFSDMHAERETLVKHTFPELRVWMEERKLTLVECDLRWGVPRDTTTDATVRIRLEEIERCREENEFPYFLNLLGERYGWVPRENDLSVNLQMQYKWVPGLSMTAMEIAVGAYRTGNPNALFLFRSDDCIKNIPDSQKRFFVDPGQRDSLKVMKDKVRQLYEGSSNVVDYAPTYDGLDNDGKVKFEGLHELMEEHVISFMKQRLELQYPLDPTPMTQVELWRSSHDLFLSGRMQVLGREDIMKAVQMFVEFEDPSKIPGIVTCASKYDGKPLILVGEPGVGKSSLVARCVYDTIDRTKDAADIVVFYHFVGSGPGSTEIVNMFRRLWAELAGGDDELKEPEETDKLLQSLYSLLHHVTSKRNQKVIIFIDACNQFSSNHQADQLRWLPEMPEGVRLVISTLEGTVLDNLRHHVIIGKDLENDVDLSLAVDVAEVERRAKEERDRLYKELQEKKAKGEDIDTAYSDTDSLKKYTSLELHVGPLAVQAAAAIVTRNLAVYNKRLDSEQLIELMSKPDSRNPLWLSLAAEELRLYGIAERVKELIITFPAKLADMVEFIIMRLMTEEKPMTEGNAADYVRPTLCLLELSQQGLFEYELRELLADKRVILEQSELEKCLEGEELKPSESYTPISMLDWAHISHPLGGFFRPSGENSKLDFYHRTMSKAVRRLFCSDGRQYVWTVLLASYFDNCPNQSRKADELPYHLAKVDKNSLMDHLKSWEMFSQYFTEDGSPKLLALWTEVDTEKGLEISGAAMEAEVETWQDKYKWSEWEYIRQRLAVCRYSSQSGNYVVALRVIEATIKLIDAIGEEAQQRMEYADLLYLYCQSRFEEAKKFEYYDAESREFYENSLEAISKSVEIYRSNDLEAQLIDALLLKTTTTLDIGGCWYEESNAQYMNYTNQADKTLAETRKLCLAAGDPKKVFAEVLMWEAIILENFGDYGGSIEKSKEAEKQCMKELGECRLLARINYNRSLAHEQMRQNVKAYKCLRTCQEIYWRLYPKSHRYSHQAAMVLSHAPYTHIALKEEEDPEKFWAEN
eukprot:GFYU01011654.1.p1 GENE.GFYU01011654.1~~GFYU01011654.1.p1  ORF type:complete len:1278 (+),score=400.29 GFYU01011654.1:54-3836(+)